MLSQYAVVKAIQEITSKPSKSFSVRGLAASTGISPGAAKTALDFMRARNVVLLNTVGRSYQYKANLSSALCRQWKILFNLNSLAESKIVDFFLEKNLGIQSILLYGSFARGTNDEKSDIDLLVITQKKASAADISFGKIKREANLTVLSFGDWKRKAIQDRVFYENVIFDSIVLFGERPVVL